MTVLRAFLMALACAATPVWADWATTTNDDGVVYFGGATAGKYPTSVSLFCGGRSPQNKPAPPGYPMEFMASPPGLISIAIEGGLIGQPAGGGVGGEIRNDVMIVVGSLGYRIPNMSWDILFSHWVQSVAPGDPLIEALKTDAPVEVQLDTGQRYPLGNKPAAPMAQALAFCARYLGTTSAPAPLPKSPATDLRAAAEAHIFASCGGPARGTPDYLRTADLDRDGKEDVIVSWSELTCTTGFPRPFCGAANCSIDMFLSRSFPLTGKPYTRLAMSAELKKSPDGGDEIWFSGTVRTCPAATRGTDCRHVWRWNGRELAKVP